MVSQCECVKGVFLNERREKGNSITPNNYYATLKMFIDPSNEVLSKHIPSLSTEINTAQGSWSAIPMSECQPW